MMNECVPNIDAVGIVVSCSAHRRVSPGLKQVNPQISRLCWTAFCMVGITGTTSAYSSSLALGILHGMNGMVELNVCTGSGLAVDHPCVT